RSRRHLGVRKVWSSINPTRVNLYCRLPAGNDRTNLPRSNDPSNAVLVIAAPCILIGAPSSYRNRSSWSLHGRLLHTFGSAGPSSLSATFQVHREFCGAWRLRTPFWLQALQASERRSMTDRLRCPVTT